MPSLSKNPKESNPDTRKKIIQAIGLVLALGTPSAAKASDCDLFSGIVAMTCNSCPNTFNAVTVSCDTKKDKDVDKKTTKPKTVKLNKTKTKQVAKAKKPNRCETVWSEMKTVKGCNNANSARKNILNKNCTFGRLTTKRYKKACPDTNSRSAFYVPSEPVKNGVTSPVTSVSKPSSNTYFKEYVDEISDSPEGILALLALLTAVGALGLGAYDKKQINELKKDLEDTQNNLSGTREGLSRILDTDKLNEKRATLISAIKEADKDRQQLLDAIEQKIKSITEDRSKYIQVTGDIRKGEDGSDLNALNLEKKSLEEGIGEANRQLDGMHNTKAEYDKELKNLRIELSEFDRYLDQCDIVLPNEEATDVEEAEVIPDITQPCETDENDDSE